MKNSILFFTTDLFLNILLFDLRMKTIIADIDNTLTNTILPLPFSDVNNCVYKFLNSKKDDGYTIRYVTARPTIMKRLTIKWLNKNKFPNPNGVYLDIQPGKCRYEKAVEICRESHSKECILIDDNRRTINYVKNHKNSSVNLAIVDAKLCNFL